MTVYRLWRSLDAKPILIDADHIWLEPTAPQISFYVDGTGFHPDGKRKKDLIASYGLLPGYAIEEDGEGPLSQALGEKE